MDLIAGLPYETYELFERSFDKVYSLGADMFQLGFLKVLKGTPLESMKEEFQIVSRDKAPYEVISTKWMSSYDLARLKMIEKMLNLYYNRGGFDNILKFLLDAAGKTPFKFYEDLAEYYYNNGFQHKHRKKEEQYRIIYKYCMENLAGDKKDKAKELLMKDLTETLIPKEVNRFLKKGWEM